jgi:uncharacterized membrane-anchored protein YhcB (DUF1043 family)
MSAALVPTLALALGLALGLVLGRRTNRLRAYARELEGRLEEDRLQRERLLAELTAEREALKRTREELEGYRARVASHFGGTSRLLRELTLQYRAVYDHLAEGARTLCPEGGMGLEEGLPPGALLPGAEALEVDEAAPAGGPGAAEPARRS